MLSPKHERFVQEYLKDANATQAAIRAGYSQKSAHVTASRLLRDAKVCAALQAARQEAARNAGVTLQRIMEEFAKLAFTDLSEIVTWQGKTLTVRDSSTLAPAQAAALVEISEHETQFTRSLRVKLYSNHAALESLLKCLQAIDLEDRVRALEEAPQRGEYGRTP
jgi:phage terminase small subunit